jgi:large subunit ribosomal protein L25
MATTLATETRSGRGKNVARRLRSSGRIPAVVYGDAGEGGTHEAVAVSVDPGALTQILRSDTGVNTLIGLTIDSGTSNQVLIKDYQVNPISHRLLHVDFYRVAMDQLITVTVPVELTGEAQGVKLQGGIVEFVQRDVALECLPTEIPEHLTVDVTEMMIGDSVRVGDLLEGVSWKSVTDHDTLIVHVIAPKVEEEETPDEEAEEGEGAAPADGEAAEKTDDSGKSGD